MRNIIRIDRTPENDKGFDVNYPNLEVTPEKSEIIEVDGDDRLFGRRVGDRLDRGQRDDALLGGVGNVSINRPRGNDIFQGCIDNGTLTGGADNERFFGVSGVDVIGSSNGEDFIFGDDGADIFVDLPGEIHADSSAFRSGIDKIGLTSFARNDVQGALYSAVTAESYASLTFSNGIKSAVRDHDLSSPRPINWRVSGIAHMRPFC